MNLESLGILIADPERAARESVARALRNVGAEVQTVSTGADVLFLCEERPPDVLIMELGLPDIDGFEVCERIRRELGEASLTIIVTTRPDDEMTHTNMGPMVRFAGGDYFIAKPSDPMLIVCLLSDLVHGSSTEEFFASPTHPARAIWPTSRAHSHALVNECFVTP